jgi:pseudomonalisin
VATLARLAPRGGWRTLLLLPALILQPSTLLYSQVAARAAISANPLSVLPRDRVQALINDRSTVVLSGNRHPLAKQEYAIGAAPADLRLERMILVLTADSTQQDALSVFMRAQTDSASPFFHHWLTPEEYGQHFGVSEHDLAMIVDWLQGKGLTVDEVGKGHRTITFSGSAAQVESAFQTSIQLYRVPQMAGSQVHFANSTDPKIPAALADVVGGVVSLHDFRRKAPIHTITTQYAPFYTTGGTHYLAPADYATIYNINPLYSSGIDGTGQSIAIVARCTLSTSNVANFRSQTGLPAITPTVIFNGQAPGACNGDEKAEVYLDAEWSGAVAKGAAIQVVVSKSGATDGVDLSAQYIVNNNLAPVMSTSFGSCEADNGTADNQFWANLWQQAASQGITTVVASGDSGAAGCDSASAATATQGLGVNGLCTSPNSTCVGGTLFNDTANPGSYWSSSSSLTTGSALSYIPEIAWNESGAVSGGSELFASGGGTSIFYARPYWQSGIGMRQVPDVALTAALHDAYLICESNCTNTSSYLGAAGTSAATPSFAGLMALVVQKMGQRQGNVNPVLYSLAQKDPSVFHDITTGNNSVPGLTGFSAGTGYDPVTGLGSVDANALVTLWSDGLSNASSSMTFTAAPSTSTYGQSVSFTVAVVSNSAAVTTGTVTFADSSTGATLASNVALNSAGQASLTLSSLTAGSHAIQATYSGTATIGGSNAASSISVSRAGLTVTANSQSISYGAAAAAFNATITGFVNGDTVAVVSGAVSLSSNVTLTNGKPNAGTWAITPAAGTLSASNYTFGSGTTYAAGTLTVSKGSLVVNANNLVMVAGGPVPTLTATITGLVNGDAFSESSNAFPSVNNGNTLSGSVTGTVSLATTAMASSGLGSYPVTTGAGGLGLSAVNYAINFNPGTVTVAATLSAATTITAGASSGTPGSLISIPITAVIPAAATQPDALTFAVAIQAAAPAPGFSDSLTFSVSAPGAGATVSTLPGQIATFLSRLGTPFTGTVLLGNVQATIPSSAVAGQTYTVSISRVDGLNSFTSTDLPTVAGPNTTLTVLLSTTTAFVNPPATATYGQSVTFTAAVNGNGAAVTSGTVSFVDTTTNTQLASNVVLNSSGQATLAISSLAAGSHTIQAIYSGATSTAGSSATTSFTVNVATLTVTANNQTITYGFATPAFSAAITGFTNGDTSAVVSGAAGFVSSASLTNGKPNAGTWSITPSVGTLTAANYRFVFAPGTLSVTRAALTVTANAQTVTYPAMPAFTAGITGFVNGDTASAVSGAAAFTSNATLTNGKPNAGGWTITPSAGTLAASNYSFSFATGPLTVNKATLTVAANSVNITYGGTFSPSATTTGFVNGDASTVLSGGASFTVNATLSNGLPNAGSWTVTPSVGTLSATNYTFAFVPGTLIVSPATLTITPNNLNMAAGAMVPALSARISGLVNGDLIAGSSSTWPFVNNGDSLYGAASGTLSLAAAATSSSPAGNYAITAGPGGVGIAGANYTVVVNAGVLTVTNVLPTASVLTPAVAGGSPGSIARVALTLAIPAGVAMDTVSFGVSVTPQNGAPALTAPVSFVLDAALPGSPVLVPGTSAGASAIVYQNAVSAMAGTFHLGDVLVPVPSAAVAGQSYAVHVLATSASLSNGGASRSSVAMSAGGDSALTIAVAYLVGDVFPASGAASGDTITTFGDGVLNTLDLIAMLRVIVGIDPAPAACSDRFDAMDAFPVDSINRGGDGILNTLDLIAMLKRIVNIDTTRPTRTPRQPGCTSGQQEARQGVSRGTQGSLELVSAGLTADGWQHTAIYLRTSADLDLAGLSFSITAASSDGRLRFTAPPDQPPTITDNGVAGQLAVAWLNGWSASGDQSVLLGFVDTPLPSSRVSVHAVSANANSDGRDVNLTFAPSRYSPR